MAWRDGLEFGLQHGVRAVLRDRGKARHHDRPARGSPARRLTPARPEAGSEHSNHRIIGGPSLERATFWTPHPTALLASRLPKHVRCQATLLPADSRSGTAHASWNGPLGLAYDAPIPFADRPRRRSAATGDEMATTPTSHAHHTAPSDLAHPAGVAATAPRRSEPGNPGHLFGGGAWTRCLPGRPGSCRGR